jgi:hypothetical protein
MSLLYVTKESFSKNKVKVRTLCIEYFGEMHEQIVNRVTGRKTDNHGNWEFQLYYKVAFRYEKDLMLFLLMASHLADPPPKEDWIHTIFRQSK